jgi:abortive infection bacteriophage resistance protein
MKFSKPPITLTEQVQKLKNRGLVIDEEAKAENYLSNISYYRLRAYTYPFQDNAHLDQPFKTAISFDEIIELYVFDRKLRLLLFDGIEKIEIALRTQIIYHYSIPHGSHWHIVPNLYRDTLRFVEHLDSLQKEIDRSNETFLDHYKNTYTSPATPPAWMSLEVSSIGLLSKLFQNLKRSLEKKAIVKHFGITDVEVFENWIFCFSILRNICAHHGRIWNRRLNPITIPHYHTMPFIRDKAIYPNKLYATISCIEYVLKQISPKSTIGARLKELMANCPLAQHKEMGFPDTWQDEPFWK